jgi:hypothetical protein
MMAVSFTLYRKGDGKAATVPAPKVNVCETCYGRIQSPSLLGHSSEARKFLTALLVSLQKGYSAALQQDREIA